MRSLINPFSRIHSRAHKHSHSLLIELDIEAATQRLELGLVDEARVVRVVLVEDGPQVGHPATVLRVGHIRPAALTLCKEGGSDSDSGSGSGKSSSS